MMVQNGLVGWVMGGCGFQVETGPFEPGHLHTGQTWSEGAPI